MGNRQVFDEKMFWKNHDHVLRNNPDYENITLSHDLYRGMPSWFNAFFSFSQQQAFFRLYNKCKISLGQKALDLGCGTGRWSDLLLQRGLLPIGVDIGLSALQYASKQLKGGNFVNVVIPNLCFAPEVFDLVVSVTVLQHIPYDKQLPALQAIQRTLKTSGLFLVCETIDVKDPSPYIFGNCFEDWISLFQRAGFTVLSKQGCEFLPIIKIFRIIRAMTHKIRGKSFSNIDVSKVANILESNPLLANIVHFLVIFAYPLEFFLALFLPYKSANKVFFLLGKKQ